MTLYNQWVSAAYDKSGRIIKKYWDEYEPLEQAIYTKLLSDKTTHVEGTLSELSSRFRMSPVLFIGFLDGINEALDEPLEIESLTTDSKIEINYTFENLYKKMVEFRAERLCELPEWNNIFDDETRHRMYKEQRYSTTIRKNPKIGRNDPCSCGSGKKYKKCCGAQSSQEQ